jgi:hypothetical protein
MGFEVADNLALRTPAQVKFRMASLIMDPVRHPYPEDNRWSLARKGIRCCWRYGESPWRKRVFYSLWFALAALFPGSGYNPLIIVGLMPVKRPRFMRLMEGVRSGEGNV